MKFHAMSLCFAGTVACCLVPGAARADHDDDHGRRESRHESRHESSMRYGTSMDRDGMAREHYARTYVTEEGWVREVIYPGLCTPEEAAPKVSELIQKQRREIAELRALMPQARTAGYENVSTVYDRMIVDHQFLVDAGSSWLHDYGFPAPAEPAAENVTFESAKSSVEHQIHMHTQMFNEALDRRKDEHCAVVRGMLLQGAATSARHISLLNTLETDVNFGRKTVSARLEMQLSPTLTALTEEQYTRIAREDTETFRTLSGTAVAAVGTEENPYTVPPIEQPRFAEVPPERPRVVEEPAAPAPRVEQPAPAPRVVEQPAPAPAYVNRPVRSTVAGRRQSNRRRPAF